ncbi:RT0821/Lpp0805 family surface protein [Rickettsiales endosymbiont of Peranema trichophorum]|uniref:RT0821/Lpp0805 family surface protein n=1 Tax=Rickettsiales endosymbiont of Peranema trichophorum TaxID=2486577 RepID=UPI0013EECE35|nr:RT0821/Lpp0805 family surface protein [Rickettsiales endosymbiont of Peranema trichophorum]
MIVKHSLFNKLTILGSVAAILLTTGCSEKMWTNEAGKLNKKNVGLIAGALGGGLIGSTLGKGSGQMLGIAAGSILGAFLGNHIGSSLDDADTIRHNQTAAKALENNKTGMQSTWRNPDTDASGSITPTKTYKEDGRYCREYTQVVQIGAKKEQAYGKACRQPDGVWEIIK